MAKPDRTKRSLDDLRAAKDHILYDWNALFSAMQGIADLYKQPQDVFQTLPLLMKRTALVDSMAIRARSIIHFAYSNEEAQLIHDDDIIAEDFIPNWVSIRPEWPSELATVRARVCKEVAHLSYTRLRLTEDDALTWPLVALCKAVANLFQTFGANLPEGLKDPPSADAPTVAKDGAPQLFFPRWPPVGGWRPSGG